MQFQIPQFIDIEDRIIGPLTLKQFIYLGAAGAIMFILNFFLKLYVLVIVGVPIVGLAGMLAFVKINGQPFIKFLGIVFGHAFKPQMFVWKKMPRKKPEKPKAKLEAPKETAKEITPGKIKEIAKHLNIKASKQKGEMLKLEKLPTIQKEAPAKISAKPEGITTEELLKRKKNLENRI